MNQTQELFLKLGTIQTLFMALYHFFIPFQFNWKKYLANESPTINWSLISINNYYSFNLLILAVFLAYFLFRRKNNVHIIGILAGIILLSWIFSFIYQLISPMPLPARLDWLGILLPAIALFNAVLLCPSLKIFSSKT